MRVKLLLFNVFVPQKVPMRTSVIIIDDDSNRYDLVICLQISHLGLLQGLQQPSSVESGSTLALAMISFKVFSFLKTIIGIFSKDLLCFLSNLRKDEFWIKYS